MGSSRQLRAVDGFTLGAYESLPETEPQGSLVIVQEIFGVNQHIREVVDSFAAEGFAVVAPQIFDRAQRDVELGYAGADMQTGINLAFNQTNRDDTLKDVQAAVEEIGKYGPVGLIGYCYGGLLAWLSACELQGVQCSVAYYGGGIVNELEREARCPVTMHFGELDQMISADDVTKIKCALPDVDVYVYPADHGFNCDHRASHDEESARIARERTLSFLFRHLRQD